MKFTETYRDNLYSTEYRIVFWGLDFDKLQEYVKKHGSRTVPLDVLNNAVTKYTAQTIIADDVWHQINEPEEISKYIKYELVHKLADDLVQRLDI